VHIQRFLRDFFDLADDGEPKGKVGYKYTIHYIEVQQVRFGAVDQLDLPFQVKKIGCEDRGRNQVLAHIYRLSCKNTFLKLFATNQQLLSLSFPSFITFASSMS